MTTFVQMSGDMFLAPVKAVVVPTDMFGVAGAGVALEVRNRYPSWLRLYADACKRGEVVPGRVHVFARPMTEQRPWLILSLPTKRGWQDSSTLELVTAGLHDLSRVIACYPIDSIAVPALGCGLGGLAWDEVLPLIQHNLEGPPDVTVLVYEPQGVKT